MPSIRNATEGLISDYRIGLVMMQDLGHLTHSKNLERWLRDDPEVQPTWINVYPKAEDFWEKLPAYSWRISLRARSLVLKALRQQGNFDCLLYHTQTLALYNLEIMRRIPTILSLDATPTNFKEVGESYYGYKKSTGVVEKLKLEWYKKLFETAAILVGWSNWVKESLVCDFNIQPDKVIVIPPGLELSLWQPTVKDVAKGYLKLLFVGSDFKRKGGDVLLKAFNQGLSDRCTLDIVTKEEGIPSSDSVRVHCGLTPNSPGLRQLFADADLFIFPSFGDLTPLVVMEAMASSLPVVATNVGAVSEQVEDGVTGLLVPTNDPNAIVEAVSALANNPERLIAMGKAGRERAKRLFDGEKNYKALIDVMKRFHSN